MLVAMLFAAAAAGRSRPELPFEVRGDGVAKIAWGQRFASPNDDWINDLIALEGGSVMAVGFLNRADGSPPSDWLALAAELTPEGQITERTYGRGEGIDAFWSMIPARDGGRIFAGFTTRIGAGGIDGLALRTDARGAVEFERAFGGAGYDRFTDVAPASDGYVLLGHSQAEGDDKRRVFFVKVDRAGQPLWERIHEAPDGWGALYVEPAAGGGFIIAGGVTVDGDGDMFAMKVDADGRELWRRRVGTPHWDEVNHGLVIWPDGRIVLVGYTHRRGEEKNDLVAATLSPSGEVERIERFGGAADDRAILAKADGNGRVWIIGQSASSGAGASDVLLARLDRQGRFEAAAITVGWSQDDNGTALLPLADGSLLLAGYSRGLGGGGQDAFVVKITAPAWDRQNPHFRREVVRP